MAQHFKIPDVLSAADLESLKDLVRIPKTTIDVCEEWLQVRGYVISRAAIHGWRRNFLAEDQYRASGDLARTLMEAAKGKDMESIADAAGLQIMQMAFEGSLKLQQDGTVEAKDITNLSAAYKNLVTGKRHLENLKEEMETRKKLAVSEADKVAKAGGNADAVVAKVREILGVAA